jgi:DNA (cytosine-5)-methyltransferase 1
MAFDGIPRGDAIDLFCGGGGTTLGAEWAGLRVVAALNHWQPAYDTHRAAHPNVLHFREDANLVNPIVFPGHSYLLASPSCTGHTRARGKERPHHEAARSTAFCVIRLAEYHKPAVVIVENVPEFLKWDCYKGWRLMLRGLGYKVHENIMQAHHCGVPSSRTRVIITAVRGRHALKLRPGRHDPIPARTIVDLEKGTWGKIADLCTNTRRRIAAGRRQHGEVFIASYYSGEKGGHSLDAVLGAITTKDRHMIVRGDEGRMLSIEETMRAMSFPVDYPLQGTKVERMKLLGNANPPKFAKFVLEQV